MTVVQPALAPPRIVARRRAGRQPDPALGDGARALRGQPRPAAAPLGERGARPRVPGRARTRDGEWVELTWGEADRKANAVAQALLDRGLGPQAAADDPLRQRDRPRAADARRLPGRRAGGAGLARLLADEPGLRQGQAHRGAGQAGARLRGRRRAVRRRARAPSTSAAPRSCSPAARARRASPTWSPRSRRRTVDDALARSARTAWPRSCSRRGSTAMPKGVLNTHGMLCANQQ